MEIVLRRHAFLILLVGIWAAPAPAQTPGPAPAKKKSHSVPGTPLDTLRQTRLWTDTGPAKDFVTGSRPDPQSLDYAPLTGTDPDRPKPRDAANVEALQAELERDRVVNEGKGRRLGPLRAGKKAAGR